MYSYSIILLLDLNFKNNREEENFSNAKSIGKNVLGRDKRVLQLVS